MKQSLMRAAFLAAFLASAGMLAGCAQSACSQPDVLAYVDKARQAHDLYAIGLTGDAVRETPLAARQPGRVSPRAVLCSAWLLSRNPGWQPGGGQAEFLRTRQDFRVEKLSKGYEVETVRN